MKDGRPALQCDGKSEVDAAGHGDLGEGEETGDEVGEGVETIVVGEMG